MLAPRTSAAAAVALACLAGLAACDRAESPPDTATPAAPEPAPAPVVQIAPLDRSALIQAFDAAASAFAEGRAAQPTPRVAGRPFTLTQAFGCGPAAKGLGQGEGAPGHPGCRLRGAALGEGRGGGVEGLDQGAAVQRRDLHDRSRGRLRGRRGRRVRGTFRPIAGRQSGEAGEGDSGRGGGPWGEHAPA